MVIQVLGCHGSEHRADAKSIIDVFRTCGLLINQALLIDAGTIGSKLTLEEQLRIKHICLTHLHFDHLQGLPTFASNISSAIGASVTILSIREVIDGLHKYIFNDIIYPDFFKLPSPESPVLKSLTISSGQNVKLGELEIIAVPVTHSVPCVGFIVRDRDATILYSGDTYSTEVLWNKAAQERDLKAVFLETSFPDELGDLAFRTKHLTPSLLKKELYKLNRPNVPVYAYHLKPVFRDKILAQLMALGLRQLKILNESETIVI